MATTYDAVFNEVINAIKLCQETQTTIIAAITSGNGNVTPLAGGDIVDAVYAMDTLFRIAKDADPEVDGPYCFFRDAVFAAIAKNYTPEEMTEIMKEQMKHWTPVKEGEEEDSTEEKKE